MADPLWAQGGDYPARDDRTLITELWDHGVLGLTSCVASQRAAGANFTLDVTGGRVVVEGGSDPAQGNYLVPTDDTTGVTVTSPPSGANQRIDLLVVEVQDDDEDSGGVTGWRYRVVAGTPTTGTPAPPATPINCEALFEIGPIVNGTLAITDDLLTDVRVEARLANDVIDTAAITTAKIADSAVTSAKIANATIVEANLAAAVLSSSWTNLAFASGWATPANGNQRMRYKKIGNVVFVYGGMTRTGASGTATMGTLPAGYRPPASFEAIGVGGGAGDGQRVYVNSDGTIVASGAVTDERRSVSLVFEAS